MRRRDFLGLAALLSFGSVLKAVIALAEPAPRDRTFTVRIDGVSYTIPERAFNPPPPPANPFFYVYEYMYIRIRDRELFINDRSRYKAQPGDKVSISYIPNIVTVNGRALPE